jgi:hypothetical protein
LHVRFFIRKLNFEIEIDVLALVYSLDIKPLCFPEHGGFFYINAGKSYLLSLV